MTTATTSHTTTRLLMTPPLAALRLGVSAGTLAKWRHYGGGPPYYKIGSRVLYDCGELDAWVAQRRRGSTSESEP